MSANEIRKATQVLLSTIVVVRDSPLQPALSHEQTMLLVDLCQAALGLAAAVATTLAWRRDWDPSPPENNPSSCSREEV